MTGVGPSPPWPRAPALDLAGGGLLTVKAGDDRALAFDPAGPRIR